jgi:hypothetical protein
MTGLAQKPQGQTFGTGRNLQKMNSHASWVDTGQRGGGGVNDECAGAIGLTVTATCEPTGSTYAGATESTAAITCNGFTADVANDVWFSFVATGTSTTVRVTGGPETDPIIEVFSGACGSLTNIGCADATLTEEAEEVIVATTVGETYYFRTYYWPYAEPPTDFSFTACVFSTPPPPANDECGAVTAETLNIGSSITRSGTSAGAQDTEGLGIAGVWEAFTISSCADIIISYCGTAEGVQVALNAIFPACPVALDQAIFSTAILNSCPNGQAEVCIRNVQAGTYYVPVMAGADSYSMEISATACASTTPPANDNCPEATALTAYGWCNPMMSTSEAATESMPAETCNTFTGTADDDVWFSFVATTATMTIGVQGNSDMDAVVSIMSGTCGSTSPLQCVDETVAGEMEQLIVTSLTPGNTYYVRVYHFFAGTACDNGFSICLVEGSGAIGMNENNMGEWSVFPNPNNGSFSIMNGGENAVIDLQIMDLGGRLVHGDRFAMNAGQKRDLDLSGSLAPGTYMLRISENGRNRIEKLVIK